MEDIEYVSQSPKIDVLRASLYKARSEMGTAAKNKINPHFKSKYADLEALRDAADPILEKYGLMVENELIYTKDIGHILYTNLVHSASDQWKNYSQMLISPAKLNDPQAFGSYMTYAERYAYKLVTGINVSDRTDDDGERANKWQRTPQIEEQLVEEKISKEQAHMISNALIECVDGGAKCLEWINNKAEITMISDLPASKFAWCMKCIDSFKKNEKK